MDIYDFFHMGTLVTYYVVEKCIKRKILDPELFLILINNISFFYFNNSVMIVLWFNHMSGFQSHCFDLGGCYQAFSGVAYIV